MYSRIEIVFETNNKREEEKEEEEGKNDTLDRGFRPECVDEDHRDATFYVGLWYMIPSFYYYIT